jgi:multidrug resistance efflux pump
MRNFLPLVSAFALTACGTSHGEPVKPDPSPYRATAVGRIDAAGEARELVAAADGVIAGVLVQRGEQVHAGQILLTVDCAPRAGQAQAAMASAQQGSANAALVAVGPRGEAIAAARASLSEAEARLANAQQSLDRATAVIGSGFVSRRDLEARTADRDAARAARDRTQAQLAELANGARPLERVVAAAGARAQRGTAQAAAAAYGQCALRSPIDGQVLQVLRREGEFSGASQGTPLLVVGDMRRRIVRAELGERDIAGIGVGAPVEVWLDGSPRRWRGHVGEMAAVMGRRSARSLDPTDRFDRDVREAIVVIDDPDLPAVAGLRVTVGFAR